MKNYWEIQKGVFCGEREDALKECEQYILCFPLELKLYNKWQLSKLVLWSYQNNYQLFSSQYMKALLSFVTAEVFVNDFILDIPSLEVRVL